MESQFLIMQLKKLDSPIKNMSEHQLIFFDIDDPRYIPFRRQQRSKISSENEKLHDFQSCLELEDFEDFRRKYIPNTNRKLFMNENNIIEYVNPFCTHCHSHRVVKWNYTTRNLISEDFQGEVKVQRYKCKSCGKLFQTEFKGQFEKGCNFSEQLKLKAIETKELNWSSFKDIASYFKIFNKVDISHETIRKSV